MVIGRILYQECWGPPRPCSCSGSDPDIAKDCPERTIVNPSAPGVQWEYKRYIYFPAVCSLIAIGFQDCIRIVDCSLRSSASMIVVNMQIFLLPRLRLGLHHNKILDYRLPHYDYYDCSSIVKDFKGFWPSFLVPYILPLNLLPGLQRIVGGFRIAMWLRELNCTVCTSSYPFALLLLPGISGA